MFHTTTTPAKTAAATPLGIKAGTMVLTLKGACAVDMLAIGDRVITRSGACVLRDILTASDGGFILCFDTPQVILLDDGQLHSDTGLPFAA